ncbi:hypothetical protein TsFJ059_007924 [Trichoderma semiorbis]|uniref:Apple domain-containing protein n=1 Tax=Trichoderma semiorbis TaxID=1491008 RepID=A0A9P8KNS8_9HYPO|nr:hypothetical protein TsFJ059_007924 [Trichoderma semiorbis]
MNRLLFSILALTTATQACVRITGTCQTGSIQPGVHIHIDDNNGQAVCDTSCNTFNHCAMTCTGNVNDAWVENCEKLHYNTGHGNFVVDMKPSIKTTCNRQCGIPAGACCEFASHYTVDTQALGC